MSPWKSWRSYFEKNALRELPPPPRDLLAAIPRAWHAPLRRSLARFQIGETGEGRIVAQVRRGEVLGVDTDYAACVALFIAEEGRHARILGEMLRGLGGRPIVESWAAQRFTSLRNVAGAELKLLVLMGAEVVGLGCYGLLVEHLPDCDLRAALHELCEDERAHLAFHQDFFATRSPIWPLLWWPMMAGATVMVLVDHGPSYARLGISPLRLAHRVFDLAVDGRPSCKGLRSGPRSEFRLCRPVHPSSSPPS